MTFSAKKLKHMKICLLHCKKTVHFIRKKHFSCAWALLLKLHLANFLTEKDVFEHLWPRILIICLVALKHRIGVLRSSKEVIFVHLSSKMTFSENKLKLMKSVFCIAKTVHFIRKKHFSCAWVLLLKLHLETFSHWERCFWASVAWHSHNLLICTKTQNWVFLEALKKWFCAFKL